VAVDIVRDAGLAGNVAVNKGSTWLVEKIGAGKPTQIASFGPSDFGNWNLFVICDL